LLFTSVTILLKLAWVSNIFFTATDYSLYKSEHTCRPDIKDILETQASFNKIVTEVNNKMIDSYGEILTEFTFFP
jgi:hypothetical protein